LPENKLNKQSLLRDNVILSNESTTGERDFAPKGARDFVPNAIFFYEKHRSLRNEGNILDSPYRE